MKLRISLSGFYLSLTVSHICFISDEEEMKTWGGNKKTYYGDDMDDYDDVGEFMSIYV